MDTPDDLDRLASDWIALWESEVAALAQDREAAEAWAAGAALVSAFWRSQAASLALLAKWHEPPPRPEAPPPAPDPGPGAGDGGDGDALRARIAELERRLAAIERQPRGGGADRRRPGPRGRRA